MYQENPPWFEQVLFDDKPDFVVEIIAKIGNKRIWEPNKHFMQYVDAKLYCDYMAAFSSARVRHRDGASFKTDYEVNYAKSRRDYQ